MNADKDSRISVLLIDFDGVLRHWPDSDVTIERAFGLKDGAIRMAAFEQTLLSQVVTGQISDDAWRECVAERLLLNHPNAPARKAVEAWSLGIGEIDHSVLGLVKRSAANVKVVLVTNGTSRLDNDLEQLGISTHFDAIVNSSMIGVAKPDAEFYLSALETVGVSAAEALFVDDSFSHVRAAEELGMCVLQFDGAEGLAIFLDEHGVISQSP